MGDNAKLRTEDVIEILDTKILTAREHTSLGVAAREPYDTVLGKINGQVLTVGQKAALDNTLSLPSALNPVVLKDDLEVYVPAADLGDIKDSVATFVLLPAVGNTTGDLRAVIADNIIYRWNGTVWNAFISTGTLDHTELTNLNGDSTYQHLTAAEYTSISTQTHTHANKIILDQITVAGSGQIITTAERARLPTTAEKQALAGTAGAPSAVNRYVTNSDPRLNTVRNPYVTVGPPGSLATFTGVDFGPFEDALVAVDSGTASAVKAIEVLPGFYPIGGVVLDWTVQTSALLIEALVPHTATLSFQTLQAGIQALLPGTGALTVRGFIFELNDHDTVGVLSQRANTVIENCIFRPGPTTSVNQKGVVLQGANSVVRRCVFENELSKGVEIRAANCRVEECTFNLTNPMDLAVHVLVPGVNASVDHNSFLSGRVKLDASTQFNQVQSNYFDESPLIFTVTIASPAVVTAVHNFTNLDRVKLSTNGALPTGLYVGQYYYVRNRTPTTFNLSLLAAGPLVATTGIQSGSHSVAAVDLIVDNGYSTRVLENLPGAVNQPFVGRTRTFGPPGSYADYQSTDEVGLIQALQDATVKEVQIFEGTYTLNRTVAVPAGVRVVGIDVVVLDASTNTAFTLGSGAELKNLSITSSAISTVTATSATTVKVTDCTFNLTSGVTDWEVELLDCSDFFVSGCTFNGVNGLSETNSTRGRVFKNTFNSSATPHSIGGLSVNGHVRDNFYVSTAAPTFAGATFIVSGNHFLGALPTKVNTTASVWQANYPAPDANNTEGVDTVTLGIDGSLEPLTAGCQVNSLVNVGTLSFADTGTPSAITLPVPIPMQVNVALGFTVDLSWSSTVTSGDVMWEVTAVFKDEALQVLGPAVSLQQLSPRTGLSANEEDAVSFSFTNLDYGVSGSPSHVSVTVVRLSTNPLDTMIVPAHLVGASVTLPRD